MKYYKNVIQRIELLSAITGLPQMYKSDLEYLYEELPTYDGQRFFLILRTQGVQWSFIDNQSQDYYDLQLRTLKFYCDQCRDAQFYYCDENQVIKAIDPIKAIKMYSEVSIKNKTFLTDVNDDSENCTEDQDTESSISQHWDNITVGINWCIEDIRQLISMRGLSFDPELTGQEMVEILNTVVDNHDANIGINWDVIEDTMRNLYGHRLI